MDRREALKRLAVLTGGTLSATTIAAVMGGCSAQNGDFSPQTLSSNQNSLVIELTERIIPETDTPGAAKAKVNEFIDHMLTNWNTKAEKEHFLEGLDTVESLSNDTYNSNFLTLSKENQIEVMERLEEEAFKQRGKNNQKPFFLMLKEFTIVGYYTSEIGASQELNSDLIPGYYDACIPYSKVGKAWS